MAMQYPELDEKTRTIMLAEFNAEQAGGNPYRSKALSARGQEVFPQLMRDAISHGAEESLAAALADPSLWEPMETFVRDGVTRERARNIPKSAERLATTEFSTWYVRGFARRLMDEGVSKCQVARGAQPKWEPGDCAKHEGLVLDVKTVYDNHRVRYWPEPGNKDALSIPLAPGCPHIIKRA
jgi:hypothetical protein